MKINERYNDIHEIKVNMIYEDIIIEYHNQDYVELFYENNTTNTIEIRKNENQLIVERLNTLDELISIKIKRGTLKLLVPQNSIKTLEINSISGKLLNEISCNNANLLTISGKIIDKGTHEKLFVKTTSGSINIYRPSKVLQFKSISGSVKIVSANDSQIKGTTISGTVIIDVSSKSNYRIKFKSISGHFRDPYTNQREAYNLSNESANFDIQTTSGNCKIDSWY